MCEDKTCPDGVGVNSESGEQQETQHENPISTVAADHQDQIGTVIANGHGSHLYEENGELSPLSTDSGIISPSSTPEVMTPHEEFPPNHADQLENNNNNSAKATDGDKPETNGESSAANKQIVGRTLMLDGTEEVVLIQDTSFTIKIVAPGCEPFDLQVGNAVILVLFTHVKLECTFYDE